MRDAVRLADLPPELGAVVDNMLPQLVLVLMRRLLRQKGDAQQELRIPVSEVDDTSNLMMAFKIEGRDFIFELRKKQ